MIIRQHAEQKATEQWDGTDIEPTYPLRKINKEQDPTAHDEYARKHQEGDCLS